MIIWRDGDFIDGRGAVSIDDRGWLIGDALFETILVERGAPAFLDRHLARMRNGCRALGIDRDLYEDEIRAAIATLARKNALSNRAACRLTISRSGGPRGLAPNASARPVLFVTLSAAASSPDFLRVIVSARRRWTGASTNGFKCAGAYAENILARAEAAARGADEAIMLNEAGRVACAASANLFVVADGRLTTPALSEGAMPGVVRSILIEEAGALGIECLEGLMTPGDLLRGVLLITNSIAGPVRSALDGAPGFSGGETVGHLIAAYERRLRSEFSSRTEGRA
ncbi:MAG: aminotransferase class IV [Pseudomonadota bacterium]